MAMATPHSDANIKQYFSVNGFTFTTRAREGEQGAVMRISEKKDDKGNVVSSKEIWEFLFDDLSGYITNIELKDGKFGPQYEITIDNMDEKGLIQLNQESGYADAFLCRLPNVDYKLPVKLVPYSFIPKGETKKKEGINIWQDNDAGISTKLASAFSKDNPNGAPTIEGLAALNIVSSMPDTQDWQIFFGIYRKFLAKEALIWVARVPKPAAAEESNKDRILRENAEKLNDMPSDDLPF